MHWKMFLLLPLSAATFLSPQAQSLPGVVLTGEQTVSVISQPAVSTTTVRTNPATAVKTKGEEATPILMGEIDGYFEVIADRIIECESGGRNVQIIDSNGKPSRGVAQFQDATWEWMSKLAGVEGESTDPVKARQVLIWALEHGYGSHWTCFNKIDVT